MEKLTFTFICLFLVIPSQAGIIYVDAGADGANDGSSWADAYKYLQDALTAAVANDQIWVAQGIYTPDSNSAVPNGTGDRAATFLLKNNVAIYGGFPAGGGNRNPNIYETTLSGDINTLYDNSDNSFHVVTGSATDSSALLDGFTITAGYAYGSALDSFGGGMLNCSGSPTIVNCTFSSNAAGNGGGIYNDYANPSLTNCTFLSNEASDHGGGMFNDSSNPTLIKCTFAGNWTNFFDGGGMYNSYSSPTVTNCSFMDNSSNYRGGGILSFASSPTITGCNFTNNISDSYGGGIFNDNIDSNLTITNCTFSGNSAGDRGGGMYNRRFSGSPTLTNCTFSENSANNYGGGIYNESSSLTTANSILWGNTAPNGPQIYNDSPEAITVSFSDVQGGWTGTGNINANPCFVDSLAGDLHLLSNSPCIDKANNSAVPAGIETDCDGRDRIVDGDCNSTFIVDMGALEFTHAYFGDLDSDCYVDFTDFTLQADFWLTDERLADITPPPAGDGLVDVADLAVLCDNWLRTF